MEASRLTLHPAQPDLDELRDQVMEEYFRLMMHFFQTSHLDLPALREKFAVQTPENVILSICITGIGSAKSIQEILQKRLAYIPRLHVVAVSALEDTEQIAARYWDKCFHKNCQTISPVCEKDFLYFIHHTAPHTSGFRLKSHEVS